MHTAHIIVRTHVCRVAAAQPHSSGLLAISVRVRRKPPLLALGRKPWPGETYPGILFIMNFTSWPDSPELLCRSCHPLGMAYYFPCSHSLRVQMNRIASFTLFIPKVAWYYTKTQDITPHYTFVLVMALYNLIVSVSYIMRMWFMALTTDVSNS
ncbi:hypothetical protein EV401DRAFT_1023199 [Pisolithus croceorrhizus]|nr:hypothetical protein EV401DRAFT_1023199 [Pisolithus croceorrhizus]